MAMFTYSNNLSDLNEQQPQIKDQLMACTNHRMFIVTKCNPTPALSVNKVCSKYSPSVRMHAARRAALKPGTAVKKCQVLIVGSLFTHVLLLLGWFQSVLIVPLSQVYG